MSSFGALAADRVLAANGETLTVAQATNGMKPALPKTAPEASTMMKDILPMLGRSEATKLLGHEVLDSQGKAIGEIEAIALGRDGHVSNVIVGVGGFLGVGERNVALAWGDLQMPKGADEIRVNKTKTEIEKMPEYRYDNAARKGTVYAE